MPNGEKYDLVVIGFGKAGKTLAGKLASQNKRVALIEKDARLYGGTCINVGCIPSKRLVMEAGAAPQEPQEQPRFYEEAVRGKTELTRALRAANYDKLVKVGVEVIDGTASFLDKNTIEVATAGGGSRVLSAEKFVINTGSRPALPNIPGLEDNPLVYVSETMMDLTRLPRRLTIIGGGYIGLEFASLYANFGSQVTILQHGSVFLPKEDADMAAAIRAVLEAKGITVLTEAAPQRIEGARVYYSKNGREEALDGDVVLAATGRTPNTELLQAERAGIELTERGAVRTDEHLRTSVENIWAAGDVCGNLQFTYISLDDSRIILSDMAGDGRRTTRNRGAFSYALYIDPPFARVGMSEAEAAAEKRNYRVVTLPTAAIPKARVLKKTEGILKAILEKDSGRILGAALLCPEAYEIINLIKLAMDHDIKAAELRDFIYTHPTMSEALNDLFAL